MASFASVSATSCSLNLEIESRKHATSSLAIAKIPSVSYQTNQQTSTKLDEKSETSRFLDFREALSAITDCNKVIEPSCYLPLLQQCIHNNSLPSLKALHAHMLKTGTHQDLFVMTFLVNVYAKCGNTMEDAEKVFNHLPETNVFAWTTLMTGYVQNSKPEVAIQLFLNMLESRAYPTNITLGTAITTCSSMDSVSLGKQIHGYIVKYKAEDDTSVGNSLCSFYSKFSNLDSSIKAFKRIKEKNVISWTSVICACGENGDTSRGLRFFTKMLDKNIKPNEFTLTSVLSLCCTIMSLNIGVQIHSISIKLGYESNIRLKNSMMYLYLKCGSTDKATKLFKSMRHVGMVTWNAMISGHAQMMDLANDDILAHKKGIKALDIFSELNHTGLKPDVYTFSSVLTVCSDLVALTHGELIHAQTLKTGFLSDVVVSTALVNMYSKCGSIERASKAFLEMSIRTLISWTAMITGFANHGQSQWALQLFEDMRLIGVRPNQITFVGVLSSCSYEGMVKEGLNYFEMMQKEYKIKPVMDHFVCMLEMFIRSGQLEEAFGFVKKMGFEPNEVMWRILIEGCMKEGNMELGYYAGEKLQKLRPKDYESYAMLLEMYISADKLEDVSKVREIMKEEQISEIPDLSWISIRENFYSFKRNDPSNPQSDEIYKLLDELYEKTENSRFLFEEVKRSELSDEEDLGKYENLSSSKVYHSEKLAVAFGLLNTVNDASILVVKSNAMCKNSHSFIKVVTLITDRTIVIRDSKRLHVFVKGYCSCRDCGVTGVGI